MFPLRDQLRQVVATTFAMRPEDIPEDLEFGGVPRWDSLGHIELMLALEQTFQVEITSEAMTEILSLPDIEDYIRRRGILQV